jgi:hypothetical protein
LPPSRRRHSRRGRRRCPAILAEKYAQLFELPFHVVLADSNQLSRKPRFEHQHRQEIGRRGFLGAERACE